MATSDWALIEACQKGDAHAWEKVLHQYERLVFSIPLTYGLSHEDAADVAQITFTILMQSLDKLQPDSRLGAWLATVAKRHTWRLVKRRQREFVVGAHDLSEDDTLLNLGPTSRPMERWEMVAWLDDGLSQLNEKCAHLLQALYLSEQDSSYDAVAEQMNMSVGSIGPTRARCLQRLRRILEDNS